MLKRKILLPFATIGAIAATATPLALASCSCRAGFMGTHDMLDANYVHHVLPAQARTIYGKTTQDTLVPAYYDAVANYHDAFKDDLLFTYSKLLTMDMYKNKLDFEFTRYFLYIDDIEANKDNNTLSFKLWAEISGSVKNDKIAKHKAVNEAKYLRDFTIVAAATFSSPFIFTDHGQITQSSAFNNMFRFSMKINSTEATTIRSQIVGVVGTSATSESSAAITQQTINLDETSLLTRATDSSNLFLDLVYSIPSVVMFDKTPSWNEDFSLVSYYFKNIVYHIDY